MLTATTAIPCRPSPTRRYWKDWRAQRIPYGRGLFYLIDTDHRIRKASDGRRSVDDLVLELLDRQRAGRESSAEEWVELVADELGEAGLRAYEAMLAGQWVLPDLDCLRPRFKAREADTRQPDEGFDYQSSGPRPSPTWSGVALRTRRACGTEMSWWQGPRLTACSKSRSPTSA